MAIKPILFNSEMVQAILAGRKTQTRRLIKVDPELKWLDLQNPKYQPGDILWVRETWQQEVEEFEKENGKGWFSTGRYIYRANNANLPKESEAFGRWKPSIHMPKEAARIFLKVTDVKVERLQDISAEDAVAEGVESRLPDNGIAQSQFQELWTIIYGTESWAQNPYVWVYSFERIDRPENFLESCQ